ncbi:hypothetical protein B0A49_12465 [Cryomyces minteri]|uniref:BHLH domain-containing protein n=1 Tax=Cryomyces minteri TaxID=331657 RepID=A0A4U0WIJ7_9PEZI|nr:hypothetical protein B0A49_12465 [Cryomyces minteri]
MPIAPDNSYTIFPTFVSHKPFSKQNLHQQVNPTILDDEVDLFDSSENMDGTGSPSPYIKDEPEDFHFNPQHYMAQQNGAGYNMSNQYGQTFGNSNGEVGGIDPLDLAMNGTFTPSHFTSQNMSSSFLVGNSGIADEELLDLGNLDDSTGQHGNFQHAHHGFNDHNNVRQSNGSVPHYTVNGNPISVPQQNHMNQMFSGTPDGQPIQSPFVHGFNYNQFRPMHPPQQQSFGQSMPTTGASQFGSIPMPSRSRSHIHELERKVSESRSPATPNTPAINSLHLGTPEYPTQTMSLQMNHRHQKSLSNQWDNTPGSVQSWLESPLHSPMGGQMHHPQISEVLKSGKHASLPTKVDNAGHTGPAPAYQTQEAKRRRRRESHNMVERRRRDNINERIHDLAQLVPQHRLEDEKIRKHLQNNSPLSPSITATGMSPPQATSLLAGGSGRRAAGNITQGLPVEDKDKGPNKGDILNGSVTWTRDLMWLLHTKIQQESELEQYIVSLGGRYPFEQTEEEKRMRTELFDAIDRNGPHNFAYSRYPGSGLRVPKHTNLAGDTVQDGQSSHSISPGFTSGGSGDNSGQPQFWPNHDGGHGFKEEEEYGMEI